MADPEGVTLSAIRPTSCCPIATDRAFTIHSSSISDRRSEFIPTIYMPVFISSTVFLNKTGFNKEGITKKTQDHYVEYQKKRAIHTTCV